MTTENQTEHNDGLTVEQTVQFFQGAPIRDGCYKLSYDYDGEGYFYLCSNGEIHALEWAFTEIERTGEDQWHLTQDDSTGLFLSDIQPGYPLLRRAFMIISRVSNGDAIYGLFPDEDADSVEEIRELRQRYQ